MNINFSQVATSCKHCLNFDSLTCYKILCIETEVMVIVCSSYFDRLCSVHSFGFLKLEISLVSIKDPEFQIVFPFHHKYINAA